MARAAVVAAEGAETRKAIGNLLAALHALATDLVGSHVAFLIVHCRSTLTA
jgi:hypothetical protein